MKRIALVTLSTLALGLSLAACSTPTTYAPAGPDSASSGFWDSRIEANRFRVSYRGGSGAPAAQVEDYALLHAADLTLANGYDWFEVVGRFGDVSQGSGSSLSIGGGGGSFGRHGGSSFGLGYSFPISGGAQLTTTLEVVLGKGERPGGPQIYDARDVQRSIGPRLPPPPAAR